LLLGIASLSFVCWLAYLIWLSRQPLFWWKDHDRASYARVSKAIAADRRGQASPGREWNMRLDDFIRELDLEDIPWDNVVDQTEAGTGRVYHFRGFKLYVSTYVPQEYWRHGNSDRMLRDEGSAEEKRQAREAVRIGHRPFVRIDGMSREERMREYEEEIRQINEEMHKREHSPP
jgi:hypothetical protein